jgi:hypothetical protein
VCVWRGGGMNELNCRKDGKVRWLGGCDDEAVGNDGI